MVGVDLAAPEIARRDPCPVIIAGSRTATKKDVYAAMMIFEMFYGTATAVISGKARGADTYGVHWAVDRNLPVDSFRADWQRYGKTAGPRRNEEMARHAAKISGVLVAVWDGYSKGTRDMIERAHNHNVPVYIYNTETGVFRRHDQGTSLHWIDDAGADD